MVVRVRLDVSVVRHVLLGSPVTGYRPKKLNFVWLTLLESRSLTGLLGAAKADGTAFMAGTAFYLGGSAGLTSCAFPLAGTRLKLLQKGHAASGTHYATSNNQILNGRGIKGVAAFPGNRLSHP